MTWSPEPESNRRPRPYQERALPTELSGQTKPTCQKTKMRGELAGGILRRQQQTCRFLQKLRSYDDLINSGRQFLADPEHFDQEIGKIKINFIPS